MLVSVHTAALNGLQAMPVLIEVSQIIFKNAAVMSSFNMVGLPDSAVRESRLRVEGAI